MQHYEIRIHRVHTKQTVEHWKPESLERSRTVKIGALWPPSFSRQQHLQRSSQLLRSPHRHDLHAASGYCLFSLCMAPWKAVVWCALSSWALWAGGLVAFASYFRLYSPFVVRFLLEQWPSLRKSMLSRTRRVEKRRPCEVMSVKSWTWVTY